MAGKASSGRTSGHPTIAVLPLPLALPAKGLSGHPAIAVVPLQLASPAAVGGRARRSPQWDGPSSSGRRGRG